MALVKPAGITDEVWEEYLKALSEEKNIDVEEELREAERSSSYRAWADEAKEARGEAPPDDREARFKAMGEDREAEQEAELGEEYQGLRVEEARGRAGEARERTEAYREAIELRNKREQWSSKEAWSEEKARAFDAKVARAEKYAGKVTKPVGSFLKSLTPGSPEGKKKVKDFYFGAPGKLAQPGSHALQERGWQTKGYSDYTKHPPTRAGDALVAKVQAGDKLEPLKGSMKGRSEGMSLNRELVAPTQAGGAPRFGALKQATTPKTGNILMQATMLSSMGKSRIAQMAVPKQGQVGAQDALARFREIGKPTFGTTPIGQLARGFGQQTQGVVVKESRPLKKELGTRIVPKTRDEASAFRPEILKLRTPLTKLKSFNPSYYNRAMRNYKKEVGR